MNVINSIDSDLYLKAQECIVSVAKKLHLPQNRQRPCLAMIYEQDVEVGLRDRVMHILACDFINRQSMDPEEAEDVLLRKNSELSNPLTNAEVKRTVKSAAKKNMTYGCRHEPIILDNCIGMDNCLYYKQQCKRSKSSRPQDIRALIEQGWLPVLRGNEFKVYAGLCRLEELLGITPGNLLIASQRTIQKVTGISRQTIAQILPDLHFEGLIQYKKGHQHKVHKIASEIVRVIPIPNKKPRRVNDTT